MRYFVLLIATADATLIHSWFDPLDRWEFCPPATATTTATTGKAATKPLLAYIPGLDGGNGSPFVQFPGLSDAFDIRVQDVSFDKAANEAEFADLVDDIAEYLKSETQETGASVYLMGESFGGLLACGVALAHPELVAAGGGLILVNAATAVSTMAELQADIDWIREPAGLPDALVTPVIFLKVGRKTFDSGFVATAVRDVLIEKKMEKLREDDPMLANYYETALADFISQLTAPKEAAFWRGRLTQLADGHKFVEPRLSTLSQPTLVVAGTADALLTSRAEAARLEALISTCDVHLVEGAGHAGTLDVRVDLPAVVDKWRRRRGLIS